MKKDTFVKNSQDLLSNLMSTSSFNLEDREAFGSITEPYDLNGTKYQIYPFKKLTGYLPDPEKKDEPVLYTFYVLKPDANTKNLYLNEVEKMRSNRDYDKNIIGSYYANFVPSLKPFDELAHSLGRMLEEDYYTGKGYSFVFHLVTTTKDYDIALIYIQLNSLEQLETKYPGETELEFKV